MAAPKRTPHEIEYHRREICRMYLQRQTQEAIAKRLGLTRSLVAYDLAEVQKRWRAEALIDLSQRKAEELARIDALEREYWRAWEASHDPWEEPAPSESYDGELALKRAQKAAAGKQAQRTGYSGYLEGVERCIEMRCRLLGLYLLPPPQRSAGEVDDDYAGADDATLLAEFSRFARRLDPRRAGPTDPAAGGDALPVDTERPPGPATATG